MAEWYWNCKAILFLTRYIIEMQPLVAAFTNLCGLIVYSWLPKEGGRVNLKGKLRGFVPFEGFGIAGATCSKFPNLLYLCFLYELEMAWRYSYSCYSLFFEGVLPLIYI